jgi:hypothetical protein
MRMPTMTASVPFITSLFCWLAIPFSSKRACVCYGKLACQTRRGTRSCSQLPKNKATTKGEKKRGRSEECAIATYYPFCFDKASKLARQCT